MNDENATSEAWYDSEIVPALAALAKRCNERGMSFLASVEYEPGNRGRTTFLTGGAGLAMQMIDMCSATAPNVDKYIMRLIQHCKKHGIDTASSFVMRAIRGEENHD